MSLVPRIVPVVRVAVSAWLQPLAVAGGVHWRTPEEAAGQPLTLPVVIAQLTGPGATVPYLGSDGWAGELMLRIIAPHLGEAEALLAQACALIPARYTPPADTDLVLTSAITRPMTSAIGKINAQAGVYVRLTLDTL